MTYLPGLVIAAGHLCLDIIPKTVAPSQKAFEKGLRPGRILNIGPVSLCTGGPVSNTGLALHKLGIPVALMGKIGDDPFGQIIQELVNEISPDLTRGLVIDKEVNTAYSVVINPPEADRSFMHYAGAGDQFGSEDVNLGSYKNAAVFHFGYPPNMARMYRNQGAEMATMFQVVKEAGITTSLDLSFPDAEGESGQVNWEIILRRTLPHVDLFFPSIEEILFMQHRQTYEELTQADRDGEIIHQLTLGLLQEVSQEMIQFGAAVVGLKLGEYGFYLRTAAKERLQAINPPPFFQTVEWADKEFYIPCFETEVVGTTGAGDATIAGFICGMLRGLYPAACCQLAAAVGGCNVEAADALSGVRTWEATQARIAAGWAQSKPGFDLPDWIALNDWKVWTPE